MPCSVLDTRLAAPLSAAAAQPHLRAPSGFGSGGAQKDAHGHRLAEPFIILLPTLCSLPSECWEQTIRICEHRKVVPGLNWIESTMTGPGVLRLLELWDAFLVGGLSADHWLSARRCAWHCHLEGKQSLNPRIYRNFIPDWNIMTKKLHISCNINNSMLNSKNNLCRVFSRVRNGFHSHQSEARPVSLLQMGCHCGRSCGCCSLRTCCYGEDGVPASWAAWLDGAQCWVDSYSFTSTGSRLCCLQ